MLSQFIKFCSVGVFNTAVNYAVFYLALRLGVEYRIAGVLGFLSGGVPGFFINRRWTFNSSGSVRRGLVLYLLAQGLSLSAHTSAQWVSVAVYCVPKVLSQFTGILASLITNFVLLKFVVFGRLGAGRGGSLAQRAAGLGSRP